MNELFPIFIKADQINILIIGGGKVATEKLHFLLKSSPNAQVRVVAKRVSHTVRNLSMQNLNVKVDERKFKRKDLKGRQVVIVAADNVLLNQRIAKLSHKRHFLLNVADTPGYCDFYLGGIVTRDKLKIAISTNGKAPILAKRLREFFEQEIPIEIDDTVDLIHTLRQRMKGDFSEKLIELNKLTKNIIES